MVMVGRHAAWFDRLSGWALPWLYRTVAARVVADLRPGAALLDVGTGPGRLLLEVARRRPDVEVSGVAPSADMIGHVAGNAERAGLAGRVRAVIGSAEEIPHPDASFDAVVSSLSAHHWADVTRAIAEQARVLRPGGSLWVFDLRGKSAPGLVAALESRFSANDITRPRQRWPVSLLLTCHRAVMAPGAEPA